MDGGAAADEVWGEAQGKSASRFFSPNHPRGKKRYIGPMVQWAPPKHPSIQVTELAARRTTGTGVENAARVGPG